MWLTILILCGPIGVLIGYIAAASIISHTDWRWAFYVQCFGIGPVIIAMLIMPLKYMDLVGEDSKKIRPVSPETADEEKSL